MAFKDLLFQLSSYPESTKREAIAQGVDFARTVGAHLTALTFEMDMQVPWNATGNFVVNISGLVAAEKEKSAENAKQAIKAFTEEATARGLSHDHKVESCLTAEVPSLVTEHARLRDLTIIPVSAIPDEQNYIAECVIFGSGRPVLIVPEAPKRSGEFVYDRIGIAWDFSRPAARAVADALPLLQKAKVVHVVTITNDKVMETRRSTKELAKHLAFHNVHVELEEKDAGGQSIGEALDAYATARGLDVLVMGAFGHSRVRDFVLGGATKSLVGNASLPILLSH